MQSTQDFCFVIYKLFNTPEWHMGCPEFSQLFVPISCASEQYARQQHCLASCACRCWLFVSCNILTGVWAGLGGRFICFCFHSPSFHVTVVLWTWSSRDVMPPPTACRAQHAFCKGKLWLIDWSITKTDTLTLYVFWVCLYIFYLSHANMEL